MPVAASVGIASHRLSAVARMRIALSSATAAGRRQCAAAKRTTPTGGPGDEEHFDSRIEVDERRRNIGIASKNSEPISVVAVQQDTLHPGFRSQSESRRRSTVTLMLVAKRSGAVPLAAENGSIGGVPEPGRAGSGGGGTPPDGREIE